MTLLDMKCSDDLVTITILRSGVFYCRVCSPFDKTETLRRVNQEGEPKYGGVWSLSSEVKGAPAKACPNFPTTHTHYMLDC